MNSAGPDCKSYLHLEPRCRASYWSDDESGSSGYEGLDKHSADAVSGAFVMAIGIAGSDNATAIRWYLSDPGSSVPIWVPKNQCEVL